MGALCAKCCGKGADSGQNLGALQPVACPQPESGYHAKLEERCDAPQNERKFTDQLSPLQAPTKEITLVHERSIQSSSGLDMSKSCMGKSLRSQQSRELLKSKSQLNLATARQRRLKRVSLEAAEIPGPGLDGRFVDAAFPPATATLGVPRAGQPFLSAAQMQGTKWIRLPQLLTWNSWSAPVLFDDISPQGLAQGRLGDCWLLATLSALAEFPSAVQRLFVEADAASGRYVVRLFDMSKAAWELIEIDDYVPCIQEEDYTGLPWHRDELGRQVYRYEDTHDEAGNKTLPRIWSPHFVRPAGNAMWAPLLEKAMAKFVGGYASLVGGTEPYALVAFTGMPLVYCFVRSLTSRGRKDRDWEWCGAQYIGRDKTGMNYSRIDPREPCVGNNDLFKKLCVYEARNYVMTACVTKFARPATREEYTREDGIVSGHAYSVLSAHSVPLVGGGTVELLRLRNPHGQAQEEEDELEEKDKSKGNAVVRRRIWNGAWSDSSKLWQQHKEVARELDHEPGNDGTFCMSWEDFRQVFDRICVLLKCMEMPADEHVPKFVERTYSVSLQAMLGHSDLAEDLGRVSLVFDPFQALPPFCDDGELATRLRWEASKPGKLQARLDYQKSMDSDGHAFLLTKVQELGLSAALGPDAFLR